MRKGIARVLTVVNQKTREALKEAYKGKVGGAADRCCRQLAPAACVQCSACSLLGAEPCASHLESRVPGSQ